MMTRRALLGALPIAGLSPAAAEDKIADRLCQAFVFGLPLLEMAATRQRALRAGAQLNQWAHRPTLSDARARSVTTPNNDTLYSSCWLDLSSPVTLSLPPASHRYQSIALMDAYTNVFHVAHAGDPPLTVLAPGARSSGIANTVRAPTPMVWALGRTYVADRKDLATAQAAQQALGLTAAASAPETRAALLANPEPKRADVLAALLRIERLITDNPPPRRHNGWLKAWRQVGFGSLARDATGFDASRAAGLAGRLQARLADLRAGIDGPTIRGWVQPPARLGRYGDDFVLRAATALAGLGALPPQEARYWIGRQDARGEGLNGARGYSLTLKAGDWPPGAFWSLTLYEKTSEGQLYFYDNPLDRYALGPGKPGFEGHADQAVTLNLSHAPPTSSPANWLPAPDGPFEVQLRLYQPTKAWRAPSIIALA